MGRCLGVLVDRVYWCIGGLVYSLYGRLRCVVVLVHLVYEGGIGGTVYWRIGVLVYGCIAR